MIILIGASSFIGVYTVAELLKRGSEVLVTGRNNKFKEHYDALNVPYVNFDLSNKADIDKLPIENIEAVILLGGLLPANTNTNLVTEENAADYFIINTIGTANLLEFCRKNKIKRLLSTCSYADVINSWHIDPPITEEEARSFRYEGDHAVYVFSKNAANDLMEYYNQQHGMKNVIFRLPPVYGVGPHGTYCVNGVPTKSTFQKFIEAAQKGEDIKIFSGDEEWIRDYVYVKDVAEAIYMAIKSEKASGLYNMTSGVGVSMANQARIIAEIFAENKQSKCINVKGEVAPHRSLIFSMEKAKRDFGFVPAHASFKEMMVDYKKDLTANLYRELFKY